MIYNRLLSRYFPSPGKKRLFFFFKWRRVPATQYPWTPVGLGFYLITWAGFCSCIYRPLWLELAANFQGACCFRLSNAQIQSPCWITSGVEQKWQIIHFLLKLTLSSSCFPHMLYSGRVCMFCSVFFSCCKHMSYQLLCGQREDGDLRNSFQFTWLLTSSLLEHLNESCWARGLKQRFLRRSLPCHLPPHWMVNQSRITR